MGIYAGLNSKKQKRIYSDKALFTRYFQRVTPYKKNIVFISIIIFIATIIDIINPLLVGFAVDEIPTEKMTLEIALLIGISYFTLSSLNWILFYLRRKELGKFVPYFLEELRMEAFQSVEIQDMSFFDKYPSGNINSRITNDSLDFSNTTFLIAETAGNFLISILTIIILYILNPVLATITLSAVPFIILLMFSLRKGAKNISRKYRESIAEVNSAMVEAIEGIQVSKSYGQEATVSRQFAITNRTYFNRLLKLTSVTHAWRPSLEILTSLTLVIILYVGSQLSLNSSLSSGTILMFVLYVQRFFRPIISLSTFVPELSSGLAAFERILEIIDSKPYVQQSEDSKDIETIQGQIEFENVDFQYLEDEWVFQNLNLTIHAGEKLAIVGATGSGKTSLVNLIARNYEFQGGLIKIDGINIRDITLESYRRNIGKVEQDVYLFHGTIDQNIRYGRQDASDLDVQNAIQAVYANEFIQYLPEKLQTMVGERGKGLSAGQRQLISFARALLTDPKILILDEATSSVDAYTEAIIQEALEILLQNRTSIIIAHRLSTIVNADRIIVMDHGRIIEEGSHAQLLGKKGKYAELYHQYFEHQSLSWRPTLSDKKEFTK